MVMVGFGGLQARKRERKGQRAEQDRIGYTPDKLNALTEDTTSSKVGRERREEGHGRHKSGQVEVVWCRCALRV
jgi:hypothetical protein